jgi:RNA polymerase sigma-70 factor (ECF subfamily)
MEQPVAVRDLAGDGVDTKEQQRLVEAAKAGDEEAWTCLYRRVFPRLRGFVARRVGPGEVEDVVADIMVRAVVGIDRFQWEPSGFEAWLFGIARRACADHHRREARRPVKGRDEGVADTDPGEALERADEHARLRGRFAMLSPAEQELLELRVVAGLSAEATARVLGKRAGAVRTAQSRALAHLRELMEATNVR